MQNYADSNEILAWVGYTKQHCDWHIFFFKSKGYYDWYAEAQIHQHTFRGDLELSRLKYEEMLSQIGGQMGLWLGLGVLQVFQLCVDFVLMIFHKYKASHP